jgi:predicted HAD superfamily Cof-like phosphohydrolase
MKKRTINEYRQVKDTNYTPPPEKGQRFEIPKYDPQTGELNPYYTELTGGINEYSYEPQTNVDFVNEVEEFNRTFGKPNNYEPTIPEKKEWQFVYDFILEELEEYKEACERGDIVEVLDALCDITYVSLGNGVMLHGLKDKIEPAYQEVQASNMSKACKTKEEAIITAKSEAKRIGEDTHYEKVGDYYIVYRSRDRKVLKSINYFRPDLSQFFTGDELARIKFDNLGI